MCIDINTGNQCQQFLGPNKISGKYIYIYRYVCIIFMGLQSTVHYTCAFPHKTLAEFDLGL